MNNFMKKHPKIKKFLIEKLGLKTRWLGLWSFEHLNKDGDPIWEDTILNNLANEGEFFVLDVPFRNGTSYATFYIRLFNDTPVDTDGLSDLINEASGNGYAAQSLSRDNTDFPVLALDSGDYQLESLEQTFSASGGSWGPVTYAVLATSSDNSGKLIAYVALATSRTLQDGDSLKVTFKIKQA